MREITSHWLASGAAAATLDCGVSAREVGLDSEPAHSARLIRTIEAEIVPRLIMTRRLAKPAVSAPLEAETPEIFDVQELVRLLLSHEAEVASAYVDTVRERGASLEAICTNLLAPAARELGLLWEEDECNFMDVTVGLCKLHQVLRLHAPALPVEPDRERGSILLTTMPGEQHTFGVTLVAQYLMRAGWDVWQEFPSRDEDILELLRQNTFTVAGVTIGNDTCLNRASDFIAAMRKYSRNPDIEILVGGPVLVAQPDLAWRVGANATAMDGQQTVRWVEEVCQRQRE